MTTRPLWHIAPTICEYVEYAPDEPTWPYHVRLVHDGDATAVQDEAVANCAEAERVALIWLFEKRETTPPAPLPTTDALLPDDMPALERRLASATERLHGGRWPQRPMPRLPSW